MISSILRSSWAGLALVAAAGSLAAETLPTGLPLAFEPNRGQTAAGVQYLSHGQGYTLFLAPQAATFELQHRNSMAVVRMDLAGATAGATLRGEEPLPGTVNYLRGQDHSAWLTGLPTFARTRADGVYPGIDVTYYGTEGRLEYDFIVAPGADPTQIRLDFAGGRARLTRGGELTVVPTGGDTAIRFQKPVLYQDIAGARHRVAGAYRVAANHRVSFRVGAYDPTRPLVIDPVMVYSSYFGGSATTPINAVAINAAGEIYVTGSTIAGNFPTTTGVIEPTCPLPSPGNSKCAGSANTAAFVTKMAANGQSLIYSTYLGGNNTDYGQSIAVDANDEAWVYGGTTSANFPVTADALQKVCSPSYASPSQPMVTNCPNGTTSLFLVKLNPAGTAIDYGTFLGGSQGTFPSQIALDAAGNLYISGTTAVANNLPAAQGGQYNYPVTTTAYQAQGYAASDGLSSFVSKISADGHTLLYSSFFGASAGQTYGTALAAGGGHVYIGGYTQSSTLPTTAGAVSRTCPIDNGVTQCQNSAWVAGFDLTKSGAASLLFSTYLVGSALATDGSGQSVVTAMAADASGSVYVAGSSTFGNNFPTTAGVLQPTCKASGNGQCQTGFIAKLGGSGALTWSTYYGSPSGNSGTFNLYGLAVDAAGDVYFAGNTAGAGDYPTQGNLYGWQGGSAVIGELNPTATQLLFGTFVGGQSNVIPSGLTLDPIGDIVVVGSSYGSDLQLVNPYQSQLAPGSNEGFIVKISGPTLPTFTPNQLTVPVLSIGSATYQDVVCAVSGVVSGPTSAAPAAGIPVYTPANNQMSIPVGFDGTTQYNNAVMSPAPIPMMARS